MSRFVSAPQGEVSSRTRQVSPVYLLGIGTAVPPFRVPQEDACAFFERVLEADASRLNGSLSATRALLRKIYSRSGIDARHTVLSDYQAGSPQEFTFFPPEASLKPVPGTAARMAVYERESVPLAEEAARRALRESGVAPGDVTHLVISTCTGFFAPGPDVLLTRSLGLRPTVSRTLLGFMGCYAGLSGLRTAEQIVRGNPEAVVLQICVELCSLHFASDFSPDAIVAGALFADGASSAVYGGEQMSLCDGRFLGEPIARIAATQCYVSPGSLGSMSWRIGDTGFEMRLDAGVPDLLQREAPGLADALANAGGIDRDAINGWAVHPGGRRILDALAEGLGLEESHLSSSRDVLRQYGNMSSSTVLFVLERELARPDRRSGIVASFAFGPGLTVEGALLETV